MKDLLLYLIEAIDNEDDKVFFLTVYQNYKKLVFSKVKDFACNYNNIEDITQETWEKLIGQLKVLKRLDKGAMVTYISFTARSVAYDYGKKERRERLKEELHGGKISDYVSLSAEDAFFLHFPNTPLISIWSKLSDEEQILLACKYILELDDGAIASIIGCKPSSIRMKLTRARRRARELIEQEDKQNESI